MGRRRVDDAGFGCGPQGRSCIVTTAQLDRRRCTCAAERLVAIISSWCAEPLVPVADFAALGGPPVFGLDLLGLARTVAAPDLPGALLGWIIGSPPP